jgi:hypothetical protein
MLRERLTGLRLEPAVQEEIVAELAGHLEDAYEHLLAQGVGAKEAQQRAWTEFSSGRELARKIRRAKRGEGTMNNRSKQIWLPGLVTTGMATILLSFLDFAGMRATVVWAPAESPALFNMAWLLSLPVFGFAGAYWSRRAGGGTGANIIAGIFPSLFYFAFPYLTLPLALVVDRSMGPTMGALGWLLFLSKWYLLNWVALPCVALLAGALPAAITRGKVNGDGMITAERAASR